jgi:hypothetical protein
MSIRIRIEVNLDPQPCVLQQQQNLNLILKIHHTVPVLPFVVTIICRLGSEARAAKGFLVRSRTQLRNTFQHYTV